MKRLALLGSALALGAAVGLSVHLVTAGGTPARSGRVTLTHTRAVPAGTIVQARIVAGLGGRTTELAAAARAPLVGSLGPVAVPSRDGAYLAYNTWRWTKDIDWQQSLSAQGIQRGDVLGRPTLRIRSVDRGKDDALEPGTFSAAWRADGALAYVRGVERDYRADTAYLRDVVVRASLDASPTTWSSSPGRYLVLGWAGPRLVAADETDSGDVELVVFDGPGSSRPLATGANLVAISPDGTSVLVADNPADTATPALRLISVGDGSESARLPFAAVADPVTRAPLTWIDGPGDWLDDRVVASSSTGLVVVHMAGGRAVAEQVIHVDAATRPNGRLWEPRFGDETGRTIVTWADVASGGQQSAQIVCDRFALMCTEGASVPSVDAPRPAYDLGGGKR